MSGNGGCMANRAEDRRVQRTQRSLREALVSLVLEKGYEAVTVQQIVARADVGRSTFYAHYLGKEQLLLSGFDLLEAQLAPAARALAERKPRTPLAFTRDLFQHVHEHRSLYRAIVGRRSGMMVQHRMRLLVQKLLRADLAAGTTPVPLEAAVHFLAGAFLAHVAWWLDHQARLSPAEAEQIFRRLALRGVARS
jgi:AcrR family transcriptional regulator